MCKHVEINIELIKYFIEYGANVNKGDENDAPLLSL